MEAQALCREFCPRGRRLRTRTTIDHEWGAHYRSDLELRRPIDKQTAAYGRLGRTNITVLWERTGRSDTLRTTVTGTDARHELATEPAAA